MDFIEVVDELSDTERGAGGFGSTGEYEFMGDVAILRSEARTFVIALLCRLLLYSKDNSEILYACTRKSQVGTA